MTESDSRMVQGEIYNILGENPDGICVPLAIIESCNNDMPASFLEVLPGKILEDLNTGTEGVDKDWLRGARIFYPDIEDGDVAFRSSQDPAFGQIIEYAQRMHCPILFSIQRGSVEGHSLGVKIHKRRNGKELIAEMLWGSENETPLIDVTARKVIRDLDGVAEEFLKNDRMMVIFPPEEQMKFN